MEVLQIIISMKDLDQKYPYSAMNDLTERSALKLVTVVPKIISNSSMLLEQKIRLHHLSRALTKIPHRRHRGNSQRHPSLLTQISCIYVSTFADLPGPKYTYTPTYRDRKITGTVLDPGFTR